VVNGAERRSTESPPGDGVEARELLASRDTGQSRRHARLFMSETRQPTEHRTNNVVRMDDLIDFGDVLPEVNEIFQRDVSLYRHDPAKADLAFREALALRSEALPTYLCLYIRQLLCLSY
jgi:hypothetical protein